MTSDPEKDRRDELVERAATGQATKVEREELALYMGSEEQALRVAKHREQRKLGGEWLDRVESDERVLAIDGGQRARRQRAVGLGLLAGGYALSLFAPIAGAATLLGGVGLLLWSVISSHIQAHKHDPYKDVRL